MAKIQSTDKYTSRSISAKNILLAIVALFTFSLLLSSVIGLMKKYITMRRHISELKYEQSVLEQKYTELRTMNEYISTPEGQERIFREKYRVVKPGEGMIIVTKNELAEGAMEEKKGGLHRFWDSILTGLGLK